MIYVDDPTVHLPIKLKCIISSRGHDNSENCTERQNCEHDVKRFGTGESGRPHGYDSKFSFSFSLLLILAL